MFQRTTEQRVELNPRIMMGKPVIKGTRIPVSVILNLLAHGQSHAQVINAYPQLTVEDIHVAIGYAASVTGEETREFA